MSRPDISFSVNYLSRFNNNPGKRHWLAAKRILRYLKGTIDDRLTFSKSDHLLRGYSDSDFANDLDERKSVSGYVFKLFGGVISWRSRKQTTISLSTTEAEYVALNSCCQEAIWLKGLYQELIPKCDEVPVLFCDNQSALCIAKNHMYSNRTKHIDIKHHFIRELFEKGFVDMKYIRSEDMLADMFTKPLPSPRLKKLSNCLGLKSRGDVG